VTIVLARSGSTQGEKFGQARSAALQVIRALGDEESFNIIDYSSEVARFAPSAVRPGARWVWRSGGLTLLTEDSDEPTSVERAEAYLNGLKPVGGTNINEALMTAVRPDPAEGVLPIVLFLTDGLPTVGVTDEKSIRENILAANSPGETGARRLFTFGVGHDVNVPLLTDLARESRAIADFVDPAEDVEAAVGRVFDRLSGPVLADLGLGWAANGHGPEFDHIHEVFPRQLGDLFEDQRLVVLGRYRNADAIRLMINGQGVDGRVTHTIEFDPASASPANSHIARLWAQQKVTWLIDELRSAGADPRVQQLDSLRDDPKLAELIDEVIALSTKYGILTEYTSFLAAEEGVLAAGRSPEFDLNSAFQATNQVRSGRGGVSLGQAQQTRRRSLDSARPMTIADQAEAAMPAADEAARRLSTPAEVERFLTTFKSAAGERGGDSAGLTIQQVGPDTLYRQGDRWVDADIIRQDQALAEGEERPEPDEVVEFGTDRYFEIASRLVSQSRQGLIAIPGEVEIWLEGARVLVKNPA